MISGRRMLPVAVALVGDRIIPALIAGATNVTARSTAAGLAREETAAMPCGTVAALLTLTAARTMLAFGAAVGMLAAPLTAAGLTLALTVVPAVIPGTAKNADRDAAGAATVTPADATGAVMLRVPAAMPADAV
jgi:hypothetical protein